MFEERDISDPNRTTEILKKYGFTFKKSLGQNFLKEPTVLNEIADAANLSEEDLVIEVGPGIGALTEQLARRAGQVVAFEIDDRLLPVLDETLAAYDNIQVIHQDILEANVVEALMPYKGTYRHLKVVANLPYYITTPIITNLLKSDLPITQLVIMMQKEVADRLIAKPNTKDYGSLSLAIQNQTEAEIAFIVPRTVFVPQPNVDSAIVSLMTREQELVPAENKKMFDLLTRVCFVHRRKTLWNNLQSHFGKTPEAKAALEKGLEQAEILPSRRAESLSLVEFIHLAQAFQQQNTLV